MGQPLQYSYEGYYKNKKSDTPSDMVKADMLDCGFENVFNNISMALNDEDSYVKSRLCMEHKGYRDNSLPRGVCHRYPDSSPCQAQQSNNPK